MKNSNGIIPNTQTIDCDDHCVCVPMILLMIVFIINDDVFPIIIDNDSIITLMCVTYDICVMILLILMMGKLAGITVTGIILLLLLTVLI